MAGVECSDRFLVKGEWWVTVDRWGVAIYLIFIGNKNAICMLASKSGYVFKRIIKN